MGQHLICSGAYIRRNTIKQTYKGAVSGDNIKFTGTMEGGQGGGQPVEFTAKKITEAYRNTAC
jgi:hypothetical protein